MKTLKNNDLFNLLRDIQSLGDKCASPKFTYGINKNKRLITEKLQIIQESLRNFKKEATKEQFDLYFNKYEKERLDIIKKYAKKDKDGNLINTNGQYQIDNSANSLLITKEINELEKKEEYKDVINLLSEIDKANNELLESEVDKDFKLHYINPNNCPDLTVNEMDKIFLLLKEGA